MPAEATPVALEHVPHLAGFDEFQNWTRLPSRYHGKESHDRDGTTYPLFGLVGEVGEIFEKIKRPLREGGFESLNVKLRDPAFKADMTKELGDVLFYLARVALEFDISLSDVAAGNVFKLMDRAKRGVIHGDGDNR